MLIHLSNKIYELTAKLVPSLESRIVYNLKQILDDIKF